MDYRGREWLETAPPGAGNAPTRKAPRKPSKKCIVDGCGKNRKKAKKCEKHFKPEDIYRAKPIQGEPPYLRGFGKRKKKTTTALGAETKKPNKLTGSSALLAKELSDMAADDDEVHVPDPKKRKTPAGKIDSTRSFLDPVDRFLEKLDVHAVREANLTADDVFKSFVRQRESYRPCSKVDGDSLTSSVALTFAVFNTDDVVSTTLSFVADADAPELLLQMSTISRSFRTAAISDFIWKELCDQKWRLKFGYKNRMNQANIDAKKDDANDIPLTIHPSINRYPLSSIKAGFWYHRYWRELKLSSIDSITIAELQTFAWSGCRWFKRPHRNHPNHLRSGLKTPISNSICFCEDKVIRGGEHNCPYSLEEGGSIVNTSAEHMRNQGQCPVSTLRVYRLKSWGYEMRSQYFVLRSIDEKGPDRVWDDYRNSLIVQFNMDSVRSKWKGAEKLNIESRRVPRSMKSRLDW